MATGLIDIQPSILRWARQTLGLTLEEAARKLRREPNELADWEAGNSKPTYVQLEKLAKRYKRPLLTFFLPAPPEEATFTTDFRTLDSRVLDELDPPTRLGLRRAKALQLALPTLFGSENPNRGLLNIFLEGNTTVEEVVKEVREVLELTPAVQAGWQEPYAAFNDLRTRIEENGVFAFQFSVEAARGFALHDSEYPIIGISSRDAVQGRIFTLLHELCHLFFEESNVLFPPYAERLLDEHRDIEKFCNQFAADMLLPLALFEPAISKLPRDGNIKEASIKRLAQQFCVGRIVIVRRLHELQYVNREFYLRKQRLYADQYNSKSTEKDSASSGGPGHYRTKVSRLGKTFLNGVFDRVDSGQLPELQAAQLIGVKIDNFDKLRDKIS